MLYELARSTLNAEIGRVSSELGTGDHGVRDEREIRLLEAKVTSLARERNALDPGDEEGLAGVIRRYGNPAGAERALNALKALRDGAHLG